MKNCIYITLLRPAETAAKCVCVCVSECLFVWAHAQACVLHIFFVETVCGIHSIYQQLNN